MHTRIMSKAVTQVVMDYVAHHPHVIGGNGVVMEVEEVGADMARIKFTQEYPLDSFFHWLDGFLSGRLVGQNEGTKHVQSLNIDWVLGNLSKVDGRRPHWEKMKELIYQGKIHAVLERLHNAVDDYDFHTQVLVVANTIEQATHK